MTDIRKYSSLCNKRIFWTKSDAKSALKIIKRNRKNKQEKIPQSIYWCETCSGYHLTSIKKGEWRGGKDFSVNKPVDK